MRGMTLMAISGSLRAASYNSAALKAVQALSPDSVMVKLFDGLGDLPLYNPDREGELIPEFEKMRSMLATADGLIISSPEYAHGITGVLKNALDWLVSGAEFVDIPVMLINTSPRASHAQEALREVVGTMSGKIVEEACVAIPLLGSDLDCHGILHDNSLSALLRSGVQQFCLHINAR